MAIGLHNTSLKKNFSDITESNSLLPVNLSMSEQIVPTVDIINRDKYYYGNLNSSNFNLIVAPTDKRFFIDELSINGTDGALGTASYIRFDDINGVTKYFYLAFNNGQFGEAKISFMGGFEIKKGSVVTVVTGGQYVGAHLIGHYESDRG